MIKDVFKSFYLLVTFKILLNCSVLISHVFAGIGAGLKLFVIDPVYRRFPRVKAKYDSTAKLWENLMTDSELEKHQKLSANKKVSESILNNISNI